MIELKPCPFCGATDISKVTTLRYTEIVCRKCQATIMRGIFCGKCDDLDQAEEEFGREAVEAWNRRVNDGKAD